jgi:hypothetical protein
MEVLAMHLPKENVHTNERDESKESLWEQVDEEAPIRANTTILLGNLAKHLSESTCKRVLLNAFTRALKDTFPPARTAGLKVTPPPPHLSQTQPKPANLTQAEKNTNLNNPESHRVSGWQPVQA